LDSDSLRRAISSDEHTAVLRRVGKQAGVVGSLPVLLLGLLHRERRGVANIGFESVTILVVYAVGVLLVGFGG
jgi:hypothetical protein